jgi:general L-amino acid transport system permease protein
MAQGAETAQDEQPPPPTQVGVLGWLRANLFNGWFNTILTLFFLWALYEVIPPLVNWLFVDAVWGDASPETCKQAAGACWAFIHEKHRLILFGRYPYEEQWRPLIAVILLVTMIGLSTQRRFWRSWLLGVWVVTVVVYLWLLGGGLGLEPVRSDLWGGLPLTLLLAITAIVVAFPISILLALGRRSHMPAIRYVCIGYIELVRGVPLVTLLFMASFMIPLFTPPEMNINTVLRAQIALIVFVSSYLAEVIRGGLQSLPRGQYEAAAALGLSYWQMQRKIIMPQALKISIAPIVNTYIAIFKDTTLVVIISLTEILLATRQAFADPEWRPFFVEGYIFVGLFFWMACFFMSKYSQHLERVLDTGVKR